MMSRPGFLEKIEDVNVNKARTLRQRIEKDVDHGQVDKKQPFSLQTFAAFQSRLINFNDYPVDFRNYFEESFLDVDLLRELERSKVINWCRTAKLLYPLKTTGDSNCLLHAVSLAMWAIEDTQQLLRRLVYLTLSTDPTGAFKRRWLFNHRPNQDAEAKFLQNTFDFLLEWESIVKAAADIQQQQHGEMLPFATLESFHLYVLANVLRRPIIVLTYKKARNIFEQSLHESNIGGIYLPLETVPAKCVKTPVIIGYNMNHFVPLVTLDGDSSSRMNVVPIVSHDLEMMGVHCLLPGEEPEVVRLLENYLQMTETLLTDTDSTKNILLVQLEERKLPEDLNLMEDLRQDCENKFREWIDHEYSSENVAVLTQPNPVVTPKQNIVVSHRMLELQDNRGPSLALIMKPVPSRQTPLHPQVNQLVLNHSNRQKCLTTDCMMYGSPEMYNLCSKCFRDNSIAYHNKEQALRRLRDRVCVTSSAPMTTIPSPDIYMDLSIVPEKCKTESCDCLCSQTTFPYCHECYANQQDHNVIAQGSIQESALCLHNEQQAVINKPRMGVNIHHVGLTSQQLNVAQTVTIQNGLSRTTCKTDSSHEAVLLSMKDEMCPTEGCRNHVSRNTEPVCHECYHKMHKTPKLSQSAQAVHGQNFNPKFTGLTSGVESTFEGLRLESSQSCIYEPAQFFLPATEGGIETSPRLVTLATGLVAPSIVSNTRRCKADGCFNYAMPGNNDLCETCYNICVFSEADIPENENFQLSPNPEVLKGLSGPGNKCFSPGCKNVPLAGKPQCHQCYRSSASEGLDINAGQNMITREEKSTASEIQGFSSAGANLPDQFLALAMTLESRSLETPPACQNTTSKAEIHSKLSNSYGRSYGEGKHICATPGCQGIRLKNKLDLCYKCYMRATPKKESMSDIDTEETTKHALNSSTVLSSTEMFLENEEEKRLNSTVTEKMASCPGITCGKLIYPPKMLCDECQEILESAYSSKSKQDFRLGRLRSNPALQQPRPHTAAVVAKCIIRNCDHYCGGPATENMCTSHFEYTQRTITTTCQTKVPLAERQHVPSVDQQDIQPVRQNMSNLNSQDTYSTSDSANLQTFSHRPVSQEDDSTTVMTHLDQSQNSDSKCIIKECLNFGNPFKQGICNNCAMTNIDMSRRSNSKCIIQECLNVGNLLNHGICNACARKHFDLSRRSNTKCIIQACMNFGSIQNQGMCNDCLKAYLAE